MQIPLEIAMDRPATEWMPSMLLRDILQVAQFAKPVYGVEYSVGDKVINYSIFPLLSERGITLIIEDITEEKRAVTTLSRYMSPELAKQVMHDRQLGGVRKEVSVLFTDIRDFTRLSERMDAHEVVLFLNEYFDKCIDAVILNKGIVDKFIGDAMMAVFGVPFIGENDATNCCKSALQIIARLKVWNHERALNKQDPVIVGIGINTGEALSGNIGSDKRMEFSVIGDSVNTASRVEALTKIYKVQCLITENTMKNIDVRQFLIREIDNVIPVGKSSPIKIYELIGNARDSTMVQIQNYHAALQLYYDNKLSDAYSQFSYLSDPCSQVMAERCQKLMQDNDVFSGIYKFTTK
eukprot:NODE_30_length_37342_cov_0.449507.p12 type:complete len:351 gc:universal NODE_30_length_37342_cov_0.449507:23811-24863(+)